MPVDRTAGDVISQVCATQYGGDVRINERVAMAISGHNTRSVVDQDDIVSASDVMSARA